jgi:hypothetical protein
MDNSEAIKDQIQGVRALIFEEASADPYGWRFRDELDGPYSAASLAAVFDAARNYHDVTKSLKGEVAWLRRDLERVEQHLEEGYHVNSMGEVQSKGSSIDRLCALREAYAESLGSAAYHLAKEVVA